VIIDNFHWQHYSWTTLQLSINSSYEVANQELKMNVCLQWKKTNSLISFNESFSVKIILLDFNKFYLSIRTLRRQTHKKIEIEKTNLVLKSRQCITSA